MNAKHIVILLSAALIYGVFLITGFRGEANAKEKQKEMEAMFALVKPFPGATRIKHLVTQKTSNGAISDSYTTSAGFSEIRAHYDAELSERGWIFASEESLPQSSNNPARALNYKNGPYRASVAIGRGNFGLHFAW